MPDEVAHIDNFDEIKMKRFIFKPVIRDHEIPVDTDDKINHPHGYLTFDDVS